MRRVEFVPGFGHRRKPTHDLGATLIVAVLLATIAATGFTVLVIMARGGA